MLLFRSEEWNFIALNCKHEGCQDFMQKGTPGYHDDTTVREGLMGCTFSLSDEDTSHTINAPNGGHGILYILIHSFNESFLL